MKFFKKIGLGIISLGLISTFYIPEAKANITLVEFFNAEGTQYAIKLNTKMKHILKKVGSGNQLCKMKIYNEEIAREFMACVISRVGKSSDYELVEQALRY